MTERGKQLHAIADGQIAELIALIATVDEAALRLPCPDREKLGDGTVGASVRHTADNYQRIAEFIQASDQRSVAPRPQGGPRLSAAHDPTSLRMSLSDQPPRHDARTQPGRPSGRRRRVPAVREFKSDVSASSNHAQARRARRGRNRVVTRGGLLHRRPPPLTTAVLTRAAAPDGRHFRVRIALVRDTRYPGSRRRRPGGRVRFVGWRVGRSRRWSADLGDCGCFGGGAGGVCFGDELGEDLA